MPEEVVREAGRVAHIVREGEISSVSLGASIKQQSLKDIHSLAHKALNVAHAWSSAPTQVDMLSHANQLVKIAKELTPC